jgi:hypothetical protein
MRDSSCDVAIVSVAAPAPPRVLGGGDSSSGGGDSTSGGGDSSSGGDGSDPPGPCTSRYDQVVDHLSDLVDALEQGFANGDVEMAHPGSPVAYGWLAGYPVLLDAPDPGRTCLAMLPMILFEMWSDPGDRSNACFAFSVPAAVIDVPSVQSAIAAFRAQSASWGELTSREVCLPSMAL